MKQIIGRKLGMTQVFATDGTSYAVTVIEVEPNVVTQVKTLEKDGYVALQVGVGAQKEQRLNKAQKGHLAKAGVSAKKNLFEIKGDELASFTLGSEIKADLFAAGDVVDVIGTSKGRGTAGVIKRWGHEVGPRGHGSGYHRGHGSFANNGRCNNRVIPGKKMAGHMGAQSATVLNQVIVATDATKNYILIKGGVPGPKKGYVTIRTAIQKQTGKAPEIKELVNYKKAAPVEEAPVVETVSE